MRTKRARRGGRRQQRVDAARRAAMAAGEVASTNAAVDGARGGGGGGRCAAASATRARRLHSPRRHRLADRDERRASCVQRRRANGDARRACRSTRGASSPIQEPSRGEKRLHLLRASLSPRAPFFRLFDETPRRRRSPLRRRRARRRRSIRRSPTPRQPPTASAPPRERPPRRAFAAYTRARARRRRRESMRRALDDAHRALADSPRAGSNVGPARAYVRFDASAATAPRVVRSSTPPHRTSARRDSRRRRAARGTPRASRRIATEGNPGETDTDGKIGRPARASRARPTPHRGDGDVGARSEMDALKRGETLQQTRRAKHRSRAVHARDGGASRRPPRRKSFGSPRRTPNAARADEDASVGSAPRSATSRTSCAAMAPSREGTPRGGGVGDGAFAADAPATAPALGPRRRPTRARRRRRDRRRGTSSRRGFARGRRRADGGRRGGREARRG